MPTPSVRIRMYRQGLGDCFLLSFPCREGASASEYHLLIDCGVFLGGDPARVIAAANDIYTLTGGHLDLVVGTHEHWDHLSGFNQAREVFDRFQIDNVWLAWTEDPNNVTAQGLRQERGARLAGLRAAVAQMTDRAAATSTQEDDAEVEGIRQVLAFFGEDPGIAAGLGAAGQASGQTGRRTTADAMRYLASRHDAAVHYCYPNRDAPHSLDGVDGVRVYVFGPPEELKLLKMSDPTQTGHETYGMTASGVETSFLAAVGMSGQASPYHQVKELCFPFDRYYQIPLDEARHPQSDPFFRQHYGFKKDPANDWRRIDNDWLNVTSSLALSLDSDTNNTSLVLAFELGEPGQGKALLFAADAQVGNWLSWQGLSWQVGAANGQAQTVTAADLLKRTAFYKVGHHGSHNATLQAAGLERMTRDDLIAMIPVDQQMTAKKGWSMPFPALYQALQQKTHGRILRIDHGLSERQDSSLTDAEWQAFTSAVSQTDLYIEFSLPLS